MITIYLNKEIMKTKKEQLYFKGIDAVFCCPLEGFLSDAKIEGEKEITLINAIRDIDTKDFIWCTKEGEVAERQMCTKSECHNYSSKSGRGVCEKRGKLYSHGEEVVFDVASGKEKSNK